MRRNLEKMPYSTICIGYMYGFYNAEGIPTFNTMDSFIEIKNNHIKWFLAESAYETLNGITEFTLTPVLMIKYDEKVRVAANPYLPKPHNLENYGLEKADKINAPFMEGMPLVMECQVTNRNKKGEGAFSCNLEAEIVNVNIESSFIDESGEVLLPKLFGFEEFWKFGEDK